MKIPFIHTNDDERNSSVFINAKMGYIDGSSGFYDRLESIRNGFWLAKAVVGIEVDNKVRVALNFPLYSSEKSIFNNQTITLGIQINPKSLASK